MSSKRTRYSNEFKREAMQLMETSSKADAEVARDLGINDNNLYRWRGKCGSETAEIEATNGRSRSEAAQSGE